MYNILSPLWHSFGCSLNLLRNKKDKLFVLCALSFLQNSHIQTYMDIHTYYSMWVCLYFSCINGITYPSLLLSLSIPEDVPLGIRTHVDSSLFCYSIVLYFVFDLISIRLVLSNLILIMTLIYMLYDILYRWKTLSCGNYDFLPLVFGSKWTSILFHVYLYSLHVYCVQMNLHIVYECW